MIGGLFVLFVGARVGKGGTKDGMWGMKGKPKTKGDNPPNSFAIRGNAVAIMVVSSA